MNMFSIVHGGVITEGLRKEFRFRNRRDGNTAVRINERREICSKVGGTIFGKMSEVRGRIRKSKVLTLFIDEIVFG